MIELSENVASVLVAVHSGERPLHSLGRVLQK